MADEVQIHPMEKADLPEILELLREVLGDGVLAKRPETWRWKHEENPFGPSDGLVARAGGNLVGLRVFLRWRWRRAGTIVPAVRAVDTVTHPAWRGRGIFRRLTLGMLDRVRKEGIPFVFNTPNEVSRKGYLKMGWQDVAKVPILVKPLRPMATILRLLKRVDRKGQRGELEAEGVEAMLRDPGLDPFLAELWQGEERLHTPRTRDYLSWRYARAPGIDYRAVWDFEGGSGAAVILRLRDRRSLRELTVVELLVSEGAGEKQATLLLRDVIRTARGDCLTAHAPKKSREWQLLRRAGFIRLPVAGPYFTVRTLADTADDGLEPNQWNSWMLSIGDLELF